MSECEHKMEKVYEYWKDGDVTGEHLSCMRCGMTDQDIEIVSLKKERDELRSRKRLNRIIELTLDYWLSQDENTTTDDVARYVEKELEVST
jgi:hypothetical protein